MEDPEKIKEKLKNNLSVLKEQFSDPICNMIIVNVAEKHFSITREAFNNMCNEYEQKYNEVLF